MEGRGFREIPLFLMHVIGPPLTALRAR
jgi:hypothetical protein